MSFSYKATHIDFTSDKSKFSLDICEIFTFLVLYVLTNVNEAFFDFEFIGSTLGLMV